MRRHMHIEPAGGGLVNNIEKIGKAAMQAGGALNTMWTVGKSIGTVARYVAPHARTSLAFK